MLCNCCKQIAKSARSQFIFGAIFGIINQYFSLILLFLFLLPLLLLEKTENKRWTDQNLYAARTDSMHVTNMQWNVCYVTWRLNSITLMLITFTIFSHVFASLHCNPSSFVMLYSNNFLVMARMNHMWNSVASYQHRWNGRMDGFLFWIPVPRTLVFASMASRKRFWYGGWRFLRSIFKIFKRSSYIFDAKSKSINDINMS